MSTMTSDVIWGRPVTTAALAIVLIGAVTILGAWFFQYGLGLKPCPLCLEQRVPYYIGIPLALVVAIAAWRGAPRALIVGGLVVLAGLMLWTCGIAVFHAGVEWKLWEGPSTCSGAQQITTNAGSMLDALKQTNVVRCDQAAWRFIGLSFAGWNVLASLFIAFLGARASSESVRPR